MPMSERRRDQVIPINAPSGFKQSDAPYRALFDQGTLGVGERALDGRWQLVSARLCEILGLTACDLLAMRVAEHTHPQDVAASEAALEQLARGARTSVTADERYVRPDSTVFWVRTVSVIVRDPAGPYLLTIVEDISASKASEAEANRLHAELEERVTQRTAQLAEAVKGLEAFSYSVSHDLRTPLRAISGFAQILARRHRESLDDEGRRYMDNIVRATAQMGHLIEDLLAYSRLGRQSVRLEPLALTELMDNVIAHFLPRITQLAAYVNVAPELPVVMGDETLLTQIFLNLIDNALTYCKPGQPPSIRIECNAEAERVVISFSDCGIGIAREHFETIFGVFQRLHNHEEYPGTGIGLATVRRSVDMLGGRVWLQSTVGEGSVFYVELRAAQLQ